MTDTTSAPSIDRIRHVLRLGQSAPAGAEMSDRQRPASDEAVRAWANPILKPRTDLGPGQLEWCRANLGSFKICEAQVIAAEEHRKKLMEAVRK